MNRVHNFGAGPAALPLPVLERAREELIDFAGAGMSVMEMSHRSKEYDAVHEGALANVNKLLGVPEGEYATLFLPGGASQQFALIPMNLRLANRPPDYINTGSWTGKAIKEAMVGAEMDLRAGERNMNLAWDGKGENYTRMPREEELICTSEASYFHLCSNETIQGIRFKAFPKTPAPMVADMSSDIMSRPLAVKEFGMIYAGAQKNLGPSGLCLAIVRRDLLERAGAETPIFLRYRTHAEANSLYNTPNTWAIYLLKLVTDWLLEQGGLKAMESRNEEKAGKLYKAIDRTEFCTGHAQKEWRSTMNVVWRLPSEELEKRFVEEAKGEGMIGLKGHRSVGGLRASIYNACEPASVEALVSFMEEFERKNG